MDELQDSVQARDYHRYLEALGALGDGANNIGATVILKSISAARQLSEADFLERPRSGILHGVNQALSLSKAALHREVLRSSLSEPPQLH